MKILDRRPFSSGPAHAQPGDILVVTWHLDNGETETFSATIEEKQTLDCAVMVEYTPEEAREMGFKNATGTFVGKAI